MIPHDDFTPHGYLDNPYHSWKINPSAVLRSLEPLDIGWHVPILGSYAWSWLSTDPSASRHEHC